MHLLSVLNISCKLSSSHHPQIDGPTKRTHQISEQHLHYFISYQQDDWTNIFHFTEFAYNNWMYSCTKVMPFFPCSGYHPRWSFLELPRVSMNPSAKDRLYPLRQILDEVSSHLQKEVASHECVATHQHMFHIRDHVALTYMRTTWSCDKLNYQWLGPFTISSHINEVNFHLDLLSHMQLHLLFRCSLLDWTLCQNYYFKSLPFQPVKGLEY